MSRQALMGIGRVIRANTTEKSIDDLRAEGKKRVRVVSSERVMAIIQAIVDDTIEAEVGEITKRDRDRIVSDTQDRFSRVLKMQQDLEQDVDDLRGQLRGAETERDRLRVDKSLLETQLDVARRVDGESDAVTRLARDVARVRDTVERMAQTSGSSVADAVSARVAEELAARDAQAARRLGTELDDLRERLANVGREATASRDAAIVTVLEHVQKLQAAADAPVAARMDRALGAVAEQIADVRVALDGSVRGLRSELAAVVERSAPRGAAEAEALGESLAELRTLAAGSAQRASQAQAALAARIDDSFETLRGELAAAAERAAPQDASESTALAAALAELRSHAAVSAAQTAQAQAALADRFDDSISALHGALAVLSARTDDVAARQDAAVRQLGDQIARSAAAGSDALNTSFKGALDQALDKITRTMQLATARPIEMSGEATDALLGKIFDDPANELTSNFDQLDVKQRRSSGGIAKSVDRLKKLAGLAKAGAAHAE